MREKIAEGYTGDELWRTDHKALILEHHMAAKRLGFTALFEVLYKVDRLRQGLLDGSLPGLTFFAKQVLPVVEAMRRGDRFAATAVVRAYSPLLDVRTLKKQAEQLKLIGEARAATESLMALFRRDQEPSFGEVLDSVFNSGLFDPPDSLRIVAARRAATAPDQDDGETDGGRDEEVAAWDVVMATPFEQIAKYDRYVSGASPFDTHQGVKGREFPRVMVVIDDQDARGFMFSYEKLFGVAGKSATDLKNEREGIETTIDRTRRLLYVTCSRAESSLAIVNYTANPDKAKANVLSAAWFKDDEIIVLVPT
jgi:DNA helicase-2/ATP-dependent DNA helicase PcrA